MMITQAKFDATCVPCFLFLFLHSSLSAMLHLCHIWFIKFYAQQVLAFKLLKGHLAILYSHRISFKINNRAQIYFFSTFVQDFGFKISPYFFSMKFQDQKHGLLGKCDLVMIKVSVKM